MISSSSPYPSWSITSATKMEKNTYCNWWKKKIRTT
jgi:hypothetical protein